VIFCGLCLPPPQQFLNDLRLDVDVAQNVRYAVMHLVGESSTLLSDRQFQGSIDRLLLKANVTLKQAIRGDCWKEEERQHPGVAIGDDRRRQAKANLRHIRKVLEAVEIYHRLAPDM
jgi:hypothetical protein